MNTDTLEVLETTTKETYKVLEQYAFSVLFLLVLVLEFVLRLRLLGLP
jgi:hypothetical protein